MSISKLTCGPRRWRRHSSPRSRFSSTARESGARCGRSADDHQARSPSAFRCSRSGRSSGASPGPVALVAGLLWGARNGVQFALTFVALKALPVLILGGFDSIPGAIVGGLIIGASEKLAEVYLGPFVGGGIEGWFPYVLALAFLLIRPEGLFGEKIIRRI
jgi:branched-chain amino acid transport system permease protein